MNARLADWFLILQFIILVCFVGALGWYLIYVDDRTDTLLNKIETFQLFNRSLNESAVNGVYHGGENFYCVYVKDRAPHDINLTDYHESCHDFIYKDYAHFCGGK